MNQNQPDKPSESLSAAARYWANNLDPQNLERAESTADAIDPRSLADEIEFARTPDLESAVQWLHGGASRSAWILDLGAGLGANSFAMALDGQSIVAADTSLARLKALRLRAAALGLAGHIRLVVAAAESLPFQEGSVPAIYTKSVLIHTDLVKTSREFVRVLAPGGRAALVEPLTGNPFVNAYRCTLAPQAWRSITHYFDRAAQETFTRHPGLRAAEEPVAPFYLFSFFAFVFQFGRPLPRLFRLALRPLNWLDRVLFRVCPPLCRLAWFGLVKLERK